MIFCYNSNMKKWIFLILLAGCIWHFWPHRTIVKNAGRPVQRIAAFGDSLTAGYGAGGADKSYPAVLARLTGKEVLNFGVSGDTAAHAPQRLNEVLDVQPDMVLIFFGGNDFMRSMSQEVAVAAVAQIVDAVQQTGAIAVVVDTGGPNMGGYTRAYKQLAEEKQAVFVPQILVGIFHKNKYKSDLIHPNAEGYELVAKKVYKVIKPYL